MTLGTILIVDDEPNILASLRRALALESYAVETAESGRAALDRLAKISPDLALLDLAMPEMDGLELLKRLKKRLPELPVVMMSGHGTIETALQATRLGAFDFVEKPLSSESLLITVRNALKLVSLKRENETLRQEAGDLRRMVGRSAAMQKVRNTIDKVAPTQGRVLITGPNGTGKELVAWAIHQGSTRVDAPFIKVNCAAIPEELIESELFGHEKGAFTGATQQRKGKFEQAHGGTLFLDEIGDMSAGAQAKVLRVLQEGELERVGGSDTLRVDVRVLAATNKAMPAEIEAGRFREDLYYRLNVVQIEVPALRQRRDDIPLLARHFLDVASVAHGKRTKELHPSALTLLMQHDWPGNIRELKNSIERLVILSDGENVSIDEVREFLPVGEPPKKSYQRGLSLKEMVAVAERDIVLQALEDNEQHVSKTATALQLERSHLYKKMKALGIDPRA
jgi:DNA-binding NtrC family response regulator